MLRFAYLVECVPPGDEFEIVALVLASPERVFHRSSFPQKLWLNMGLHIDISSSSSCHIIRAASFRQMPNMPKNVFSHDFAPNLPMLDFRKAFRLFCRGPRSFSCLRLFLVSAFLRFCREITPHRSLIRRIQNSEQFLLVTLFAAGIPFLNFRLDLNIYFPEKVRGWAILSF